MPSLSDLTAHLPSPPRSLQDLPKLALPSGQGRRHRRQWVGRGHAHIELRTGSRPGSGELAAAVTAALERVEGVHWAEVNGVLGRVVVAFDDGVDVADLVDVVEGIEEEHEVHEERFSHERIEPPGDGGAVRRTAVALAADVLGTGVAVGGAILRATPLPVELGSLASLLENQPRVRRELEDQVGPVAADLGLAVASAVGQALSQGPVGLAVDAAQRVNGLLAAIAQQRLWGQREGDLAGSRDLAVSAPIEPRDRPVELASGPVERYADRAGVASIAAGAAAAAVTRSPRRAGAMLLAGMPKPARAGREAFAARFEHELARRGVLVMDRRALRRLDRIGIVVLDHDVVVTGRYELDQVATDPSTDRGLVHRHLRRLFDPARPQRSRRDRSWRIGPLASLDVVDTPDADELRRSVAGDDLLGLARGDELVAVFAVAAEVDPAARALIDEAREAGRHVVVASPDPALARRARADRWSPGGGRLAESVRSLQADGTGVLLVARDAAEAFRAADVGVGLMRQPRVPWGADLVCDDLDQVRFVARSCGVAPEVSRQSAAINLVGSSLASLAALDAATPWAPVRSTDIVNGATFAAMANGVRAAASLARSPLPVAPQRHRWHEMPRSAVLRELDTELGGLREEEARARRPAGARPRPQALDLARAIVDELANPLTPVLAGGALLSASVGSVTDAAIVGSVMALNGTISGVQRHLSERAVRRLVDQGQGVAHVRRQGVTRSIPPSELVEGDIVLLAAGDTVPADCRLLQSDGLEVDEASLTGESEPVRKHAAASFGALITDRTCMAYEGTAVVAGAGTAVVVATGDATEAAARQSLAGLVPSTGGVEARLTSLGARSLPVAGAGGVLLAASQVVRGGSVREALGSGVSLAVAAVPEGLPMLATIGQLSSARRLSTRDVLVRNPRAVEALGRVEVLCVDKTGTLTRGRIEVRLASNGEEAAPPEEWTATHRAVLGVALRATPEPNGGRSLPHFTDRAVVDAAAAADISTGRGRQRWVRSSELGFAPGRPYHAVWGTVGGRTVLSVKGAPETLLDRCRTWRRSDGARPVRLDGARRAELDGHVDQLARRGLRILAVAQARLAADTEAPEHPTEDDIDGLTLLGFVALADPVRATAAAAVAGLQGAGVQVVMVTGDHPSTAEGIAAELGILDGRRVLAGAELERMADDELVAQLGEISVFARVTPAQKVRIVRAYRSAGTVVAMTGDGANDASAIRLADAGIAMGRRCAPAARSAADVIITDDRIETLVDAIIEGRSLWASVRDALAILLGGNLGEIGFILAAGGIAGRPPLTTRQILLVNLLTDVAPSLAIVARPPMATTPDRLSEEGPDRSLGWQLNRAIVQRATVTALGATGAWSAARLTGRARRAGTVGLVALVGTQLAQTLQIGRTDPLVAVSALGSAAVLAGIVQTPGVSQFFGCTPLGPIAWAQAMGGTVGATAIGRFVPGAIDLVVDHVPGLAAALAVPPGAG